MNTFEIKKHGGLQISIISKLLVSRYITNSAVRAIVGDYGNWEDTISNKNYRLVVAGGDGSITIVDENV